MENKVLSAEAQHVSKVLRDIFKSRREELNLHQSQVAEQLGITQPYYSMLERGDRNIDFYLVWAICRILGISLREIETALLSEDERHLLIQARELRIEKCLRELLAEEHGLM